MPLAEVLGSASTADAHHITAPSPGGSGAVACMELALAEDLSRRLARGPIAVDEALRIGLQIAEALEAVPSELAALVDNVVFVIEADGPADDPDLLGLYEGVALTERGGTYAGALPDRITIYRNPTLRMCDTFEDVVEEVNITVVHEIAHHFGIDDDRLHELGYD